MRRLAQVLLLLAAPFSGVAQELPGPLLNSAVNRVLPSALADFRELLRLPNDARQPEDIEAVVLWLEHAFGSRGFRTERIPTPGSPLLLAERGLAEDGPAVLVYLQADGQPVDPTRWSQPDPWDPVVKRPDGHGGWVTFPWTELERAIATAGEGVLGTGVDPEWRVFARSASDSKGPIAQFLAALDALDGMGHSLPFSLKVIVDTEEELGSPHLAAAVERHRERLAAEMLAIFDGPPHGSGQPTLFFGARGIATFTLTVFGPRAPLHSGHFGNYAPNPALRLARLLAGMKDDDGRVTLRGWYDGVDLDPETRRVLAEVPDDEAELRRALGIIGRDRVAGSLQEAIQFPSLNVRGMRSGWVGPEVRTIVPDLAVAEVDIRLVPGSDPERLLAVVREHIVSSGYLLLGRDPTDEERESHERIARFDQEISYGAFRTEFESLPGRWMTGALERLNGEPPIRIRMSGGSIPIAPFVITLGLPAVAAPTVNPDNNQHAPDENLRLEDFILGIRSIAAILGEPLP